jgi:dTDP-D-glucose 4,6-dehydratase
VPKITNTMRDLDWAPRTDMDTALRKIFEAYRGQIAQARALVDEAGN